MTSEIERLREAIVDLSVAQGYDATSLEEVLERAGVSRTEFTKHYRSKEECAIEALGFWMADHQRVVRAAYDSETVWVDSLRAAGYASVHWQWTHLREVRYNTMSGVSELGQALRERDFRALAELIDAGREVADDPDSIPPYTAERIIGSIVEITTRYAQRDDFAPFKAVPELMYLAVRPYLGEEAGRRELTIPPPRWVEAEVGRRLKTDIVGE